MDNLNVEIFSDMKTRKTAYLNKINDMAEKARLAYTAQGAGQAMTYEAKYLEAVKGDGPFLRAEAEALEMTVADVAKSVIEARQRWEMKGAAIEAARLKAKQEIKQAGSATEMSRILTSFSFLGNDETE